MIEVTIAMLDSMMREEKTWIALLARNSGTGRFSEAHSSPSKIRV